MLQGGAMGKQAKNKNRGNSSVKEENNKNQINENKKLGWLKAHAVEIVIAILLLMVSLMANGISTDNSRLSFNATVELNEIDWQEEGAVIPVMTGEGEKSISALNITVRVAVESGGIESLYLVTRYADEYEFELLNDATLRRGRLLGALFPRRVEFERQVPFDMMPNYWSEEEGQGVGLVYLLAVGTDGEMEIATIVIEGTIMLQGEWLENYSFVPDTFIIKREDHFTSRIYKQNELITLPRRDFPFDSLEEGLEAVMYANVIPFRLLYEQTVITSRMLDDIEEIRRIYGDLPIH